ncbi:MAG: glycosyltransferase family 2 protein [Candidatus Woesebacteria bacterium]
MHVSVVIPTYNGKSLLEKNLPSVLEAIHSGDELIIVDDASTDESVKFLTEYFHLAQDECLPDQSTGIQPKDRLCFKGKSNVGDVFLIVNAQNQRFAASCNRGVAEAHNEIIILLNNDVAPEKNILDVLLPHFNESLVFAVGCKELASSEGNKEYGRAEGWFERGFYIHKRADNQNQPETAWVSGGSGAFRRSGWIELGGFDVDYKPAYWEDIDLSFRARKKGWQVLFEPTAVVHHNHESTNGSVFGKRNMEVMAYKNQILFMWKNASTSELVKHVFWLPYHLIFTTIRSSGAFLLGFWQALLTIVGIV